MTDTERLNRLRLSVRLLRADVAKKVDWANEQAVKVAHKPAGRGLWQEQAIAYASIVDLIDTMMRENNLK